MQAAKLFWFFFWRMVLRGLALGAGLGTVYGLLVGGLTFPYGVGFLIAGPFFGTVGGLFLGAVGGVVLFAVTLLCRSDGTRRYRTAAGLACAVASMLAVVSPWEVASRRSGAGSLASELTFERYLAETLIFLVIPAIGAGCALWWAARRVAEQYISESGEPVTHSPTYASSENSAEESGASR